MRFAFSIVGWVVSAALTSLACLYVLLIVSNPSFPHVPAMASTAAGLMTLAVATHPFMHDGRSALATTGSVSAGFLVAFGFFTLTYLDLTRFFGY